LIAFSKIAGTGLGVTTGFAAGLIGVGGGEFRLPGLLYLLRDVRTTAAVNMVVGLATVSLSLIRRRSTLAWTGEWLLLVGIFAIASALGSVLGVVQSRRLASPTLRRVVQGYLILVGFWMLGEALTATSHGITLSPGIGRAVAAFGLGFAIAAVSGALGVAGGEMRIPALHYLFGLSLVEAGTISLAASIPTVAAGALAYRRLGHLPSPALGLAGVVAAASLIGVFGGTAVLPFVDRHTLKGVLGAILLFAALGLHRIPAHR
jgi:uncharacterized protein